MTSDAVQRKNMVFRSLLLLSGSLWLVSSAKGATVFSTTGTFTNCLSVGGDSGVAANGVVVKREWTQTRGYTNVTISAALQTFDARFTPITAYLTTQAGPGTTVANQIGSCSVSAPVVVTGTTSLTTLFTGLTLGPGTYHLTLAGDPNSPPGHPQCVSYNNVSQSTATDTGVSGINDRQTGGGIAAYPPATTFGGSFGVIVLATVTGDVIAPPAISKSFGASAIGLGQSTSLSFTITNSNPNGTPALNGVGFTDTLPANLVVATPNGLTGSCGVGGTITATAGSGSVSLAGATLPAGASCTFSLNVTGTAAGTSINAVTVNSTNAGQGNTATAQLIVAVPPTIAKSFAAAKILPGGTSTLSLVITNPNGTVAVSGVGVVDPLPTGVTVSGPVVNTCGGAISGLPNSIILTGGSIAPFPATCTITTTVTSNEGIKVNLTNPVTSVFGTGNAATATLTAATPPVISKSFGVVSIGVPGSTTLTFTLFNPNNTTTLTGVTFTDTLPTGLVVSTPNGLTGACDAGVIVATAGGNSIALTSPGLPAPLLLAQTGCTFSVKRVASYDPI